MPCTGCLITHRIHFAETSDPLTPLLLIWRGAAGFKQFIITFGDFVKAFWCVCYFLKFFLKPYMALFFGLVNIFIS
jgi:hypothetical protein